MTPQEKATDLMTRFEKVGCAAVTDVVEYSAIKSAIICCRELIQELAYGKTNSVNEEQLSDYHYRLMYWNEVEGLLINEQKDNRSVANLSLTCTTLTQISK